MLTWMTNLKTTMGNREVLILHGSVRDRYIHPLKGIVYNSLTKLLHDVFKELSLTIHQIIFHDPLSEERVINRVRESSAGERRDQLSAIAPDASSSGDNAAPSRTIAKWVKTLIDIR